MPKRFRAAVIGGSGYGGAELIRRLLRHPEVELTRVSSVDFVGEPLSTAHPNLEGQTSLTFEALSPAKAAEGMDVVLLGLPHKVAAKQMPELLATGARIVDLSGDFRLRDHDAYARYYGGAHPAPELLDGRFVYGLPELHRERLRGARLVASPGCFATAVALGLLPLARAGLLRGEIDTVGITGSSGSGIAPSAGTHHPARSVNLKTYKPLEHQHMPEIVQTLTDAGGSGLTLRFVPVSAPLSRGILVTSFARVDEAVSAKELVSLYASAFDGQAFTRVPKKRLPEVLAVHGTNFCEVGLQVGEAQGGQRVVSCFSALDNLIKGGAGQAIQSMNLMLGLDERTTLEDVGGSP